LKEIIAALLMCFPPLLASAQQPAIVQPGAPGQPTKTLPANTTAKLPPLSAKDVEFMQGMIMHHAQAVEMTALIQSRTESKSIRKLGAKISQSQMDEINFMERWLKLRGEKTEMQMPNMSNPDAQMTDMHNMSGMRHSTHSVHSMPGMLTPTQMEALKNAQGAEFDRLFLRGMIQHHQGALVMVKDLFAAAGAGQDAELFNFASDVDTGQRGEIKIMQNLLDERPKEEKR
jgi:uncharacterized protein (DUF305 family)